MYFIIKNIGEVTKMNIYFNKQARLNYFRHLVVTNILDDESYSSVVKSRTTPLFQSRPISPPLGIQYSNLTSECYAEDLVNNLNKIGGKTK